MNMLVKLNLRLTCLADRRRSFILDKESLEQVDIRITKLLSLSDDVCFGFGSLWNANEGI